MIKLSKQESAERRTMALPENYLKMLNLYAAKIYNFSFLCRLFNYLTHLLT